MLLFLLPAAWGLWHWWKNEKRFGEMKKRVILAVRGGLFLLLILALAGIHLLFPALDRTVVFVVDRSASVKDPDAALRFIEEAIRHKRPEDRYAIVTTGASAAVEKAPGAEKKPVSVSAVVGPHATDLAAGVRLAAGLIPDDSPGSVVVLSDGLETKGDARQEVLSLRSRGIRVDAKELPAQSGPEAWIDGMDAPGRMYAGEEAQIRVKVGATAGMPAVIRLYEGQRLAGERRVNLRRGEQTFAFSVKASEAGWSRFRAELSPGRDGQPENNAAFALSRVKGAPSVLLVEGKPGEGRNLASALKASGVRVEVVPPAALPDAPEGYARHDSVILANVPASAVPERKMERIRQAVKDLGTGLVMTGGDEGFALGGWFRTPVEEALPVRMELTDKKRVPPLALMLVIDKSGSMMGEKMEMAKEAAVRATELLTTQDRLGVLAFDAVNHWVFKPEPVRDRSGMQGQIGSIPADGGTMIFPALQEAYQEIRKVPLKRRHILLLTDGQSPAGDYEGLIGNMKREGITLSTVAVGTDADQYLLRNLAAMAGGRYYSAETPDAIPTIFSKEAALATRSYVMDRPFVPKWSGAQDWQASVGAVPPLRAYVASSPKQTAEKALVSPERDPVLARWQYGLGRSVAWTSDVNGKWSKEWVTWNGFARVWNQVVGWTFPRDEAGGVSARLAQEGGQPVIRFSAAPEGTSGIDTIRWQAVDEQGNKMEGTARMNAPGEYAGRFPADKPGAYLVQAVATGTSGEKPLGTFGVVVPVSAEFKPAEGGRERLSLLAASGGGKLLASPDEVFAGDLESKWSPQDLSWWCLLLAAMLWPLDVAVRKISLTREEWAKVRRFFHFSGKRPEQGRGSDTWQHIRRKTRKEVERRVSMAAGASTGAERLGSGGNGSRAERAATGASGQKPPAQSAGKNPQEKSSPNRAIPDESRGSGSSGSHLSRLLEAKKRASQKRES
jgi:uncharacterized membrane protein